MNAAEMLPALNHLDLPDQRIAYRDRPGADPDALPLLLLHGGAVDSRMWGPQLGAFPERRMLAPEARGHGGSSDADAPYRLVDDVVALLDALEIAQVVAVGISMGGSTAGDLALEHPQRVAGILVGGTGTSEIEFTDPWAVKAFADWRDAESGSSTQAWIDVLQRFTAGPHRTLDQVDPALRDLVQEMARSTLDQHLRLDEQGVPVPPHPPTPVTRTWERVGGLRIPVLALGGELDGDDHRRNGRRLAEATPRGRYVELPGVAHYPNIEDPVAFNAAVRELLGAL